MRINKILDALIEFSYLAAVFITPIYFAVFLKNNNVFELNKIVLFKILVLLFFLFTAIKIIICCREAKQYILAVIFNKYLIIPLLFLLSLAAATIFSQNLTTSLYGLYSRQQGLVSYIFYFLFFILLLLNIKNFIQVKRIVKVAIIASFFVSLYGLVQVAGFDFMNWTEPIITSGRISSTLGQPNFLASYLLLVIPLAGYLFLEARGLLIKFCWLVVLFLDILCLFFTYSRGGWLGLLTGLAILALIYLWANRKTIMKKTKNLKIIFSLIILIVLLSSVALAKNDFFLARLKSSFDLKSGSIAARINFWQASLEAIKDRPLLGYGLDTQGEIFAKYYKKDWAVYGQVNVYPNRAHNLFLDTMLTSGFIGLIFYLALLYLFFKLIRDNIRMGKARQLSLAVFLAITCYLISLLFGFAIVVTNIYFWLFLAIAVAINKNFKTEEENITKSKISKISYKLFLLLLIFIVSGAVFFQINKEIKYLVADHYFREFKQFYVQRQYFSALQMYNFIEKQKIRGGYYEMEMALMLSDWLAEIKEPAFRWPGEEILKMTLNSVSAGNYGNIFITAKIQAALGNYDLAKENFKKIIKLSPEIPLNYRELAKLYVLAEDFKKAEENYNQALMMLPDINNPYMNDYHRGIVSYEKYLIFKGLGELYFEKGLFREARDYLDMAYRNNIIDISLFKKIADIYYLEGDLDIAILYNRRGMVRNPKDYAWPFALAILYNEQGDREEAREYAAQALSLSPENEKIKKFMLLL